MFCLSFADAHKRKTFGKALGEHPVIRWKLAEMARQVESTQAMLETLTWQMKTMTKEEQNTHLAGDCALIKAHATKVFEYCAREAAQIFGGNSYIRGGSQGERVERLYREVRAYAIPGGSEESAFTALCHCACSSLTRPARAHAVLLDLGVRQAMKAATKAKM